MSTLFTKIIQGDLPCYKIAETEMSFAFLALDQINPGHTLVVPKIEVDHLQDVPPAHLADVMALGQRISTAIRATMACRRVGVMVQGFEVPHFHVHLVPVSHPGELDFARAQRLPSQDMERIQKALLLQMNSLQGA